MTMQIDHRRPKTIKGIKSLATRIKKRDGLRHCAALDLAAAQAGFANYRHALASISEIETGLTSAPERDAQFRE